MYKELQYLSTHDLHPVNPRKSLSFVIIHFKIRSLQYYAMLSVIAIVPSMHRCHCMQGSSVDALE